MSTDHSTSPSPQYQQQQQQEGQRTLVALVLDRGDGQDVGKRLKDKGFADARYVLQLLHQMVPLLNALEEELGFVHDDLRLDNIIDNWPDQQQQEGKRRGEGGREKQHQHQQQQQQEKVWEEGGRNKQQQQELSEEGGRKKQQQQQQWEKLQAEAGDSKQQQLNDSSAFQLFDFGLSNINPARFSVGAQARASREEKKRAVQQLEQQGESNVQGLGFGA